MAVTEPVTNDTSIPARFRSVSESMPDTAALVSLRERYTYAEIDRWSDEIASELIELGAPYDKPVAVVMRELVPIVPALLAVLKAGHFFTLLDAAESQQRLESMLVATGSTHCLVGASVPSALRRQTLVRVSPPRRASVTSCDRPPNHLLQVVFTAGTTGQPKAVAWPQRGYVERLVHASSRTGRAFGERVSYTAIPGHARASGEIFGALLNGATLCTFDPRTDRLDSLAALIERERISTLVLTPGLFRRFMRTLPPETDLSSVRKLRLGADVVTVADVEAWRARFPRTSTLERAYASTETGRVLHMSITHDMPVPGPLVPMGRPVPGVEVFVVDEAGNPVPDGMTGELVVRGPEVARGYWRSPESSTIDPSGPVDSAFRTGDLVRREHDGLFYFIGRIDARLKIHGRRIDPVEVESAIVLHARVREAVAFAEPDATGEAHLAAWVVPGEEEADARLIRTALRGNVPDWMIPTRVHFVDSLPSTSVGKVDRAALSTPVLRAIDAASDRTNPLTTSSTVSEVWSRVLGCSIRDDDDFFEDLGGTSLAALEIVTELSRVTGRPIPLSLLLELNTVRKMSGYLDAKLDTHRTVIALRPDGSLPPLFCISGKGGSVIALRPLADALGPSQPLFGVTHHGIDPDALPSTLASIAAIYVDAIRERQGAGPYYLAGYSAGGFIAFEIARQLVRAGDDVAFVGLLDTALSRRRVPFPGRCAKYLAIFRRSPTASALRFGRALIRRTGWAVRWLRTGGATPFVPQLEANRFYDSLDLQGSILPYTGHVTLFRARFGSAADCPDPDSGWRDYCAGGLTVMQVEGEHETILNADVGSLATALSSALASARAAVALRECQAGRTPIKG